MGAAEQISGDYDKRGPDFETILVGPVTERIIDADRLVRREFSNGFPNWSLYRAVYAGDTHVLAPLRAWCVAYAIAYCEAGGVRKGLPAEEIGCLAGWDAFYALLHHKWLIAGMDVADVAGVDPKTYRKVRDHVYRANRASLEEYWMELQIAIRKVAIAERRVEQSVARGRWSEGRGFDSDEVDVTGTGCWRAYTPR